MNNDFNCNFRVKGPVFIVGTERSGSNLLRVILNSHPDIYIPHPPHIMKDLGPLEHLYGDLKDDRNFRRLINDAAKLIELHFFPWEIAPSRPGAFDQAAARNLYCVKAAFYEQYRLFKGAKRWGCKSTFMVHYADLAVKHSPGAKFIHLVRDGRDVAVSAKNSVFNHFHPYYVARLWSLEQKLAAGLSNRLGKEGLLTVRYEDLTSEPERTVKAICGFLEEDYSGRLLRYFETEETKQLAGYSRSWGNCAKPILKDNSGKYKKSLSAGEIRIFETESFPELEQFGYPLDNPRAGLLKTASAPAPPARRARYFLREKGRMAYILLRSLFTDRNASAMLKKRVFLGWVGLKIRIIKPYEASDTGFRRDDQAPRA
ncbi:MAG: sulfotransferase [Elusimicrobia bacterium]|nr:sulfotransferase [Elusimicrobiota bacterium]